MVRVIHDSENAELFLASKGMSWTIKRVAMTMDIVLIIVGEQNTTGYNRAVVASSLDRTIRRPRTAHFTNRRGALVRTHGINGNERLVMMMMNVLFRQARRRCGNTRSHIQRRPVRHANGRTIKGFRGHQGGSTLGPFGQGVTAKARLLLQGLLLPESGCRLGRLLG